MQERTNTDTQAELLGLLLESARGNQQSFEVLYKETSNRLYGVALKILRRRDWAEEVMQEAYVRIWHNASEYIPERGSVLTWMITILRYRAIDKLRANKRSREDGDFDEEVHQLIDDSDPLNEIESSAYTFVLQGCLEELVEKQRQSIALAFYEGLTHEQLSKHYRAPLGTVKSWIRRGLILLRRCLNNGLQQRRAD